MSNNKDKPQLPLLHPSRPAAAAAKPALSFQQRKRPAAAAPPLQKPRKAAKLSASATPRAAAAPPAPSSVLAGCVVHLPENLLDPFSCTLFKRKLGALGAAFSDAPAAHVTHFLVGQNLPARWRHAEWLSIAPHAVVVRTEWASTCLGPGVRVPEDAFLLQLPPAPPVPVPAALPVPVPAAGEQPQLYKKPPNERGWTRVAYINAMAPPSEDTDGEEDAAAGDATAAADAYAAAVSAADTDDDDEDFIAAGMEAEAAAKAGNTASEEVLLPRPATAAGYACQPLRACQPSRGGAPPNKNKRLCEVFDGLVELYSVSQARTSCGCCMID
jgi:hypothetical protein